MIELDSRIALAGDWHGNARFAKSMISAVTTRMGEPVADIIHVGDFGLMGDRFREYVATVNRACRVRNVRLWVIPGNHENHAWIAEQESYEPGSPAHIGSNTRLLPRGYRFKVGERIAVAVGGAVSVDRKWRVEGESWWPQEELTDEQCEQICTQDPVDYLFTHDMPKDSGSPHLDDEEFVRNWGQTAAMKSWAHSARIRKIADALTPELIVHGHMHARYTRKHQWTSLAGEPYDVTIEGLACDGLNGNTVTLDSANSQVTTVNAL